MNALDLEKEIVQVIRERKEIERRCKELQEQHDWEVLHEV